MARWGDGDLVRPLQFRQFLRQLPRWFKRW